MLVSVRLLGLVRDSTGVYSASPLERHPEIGYIRDRYIYTYSTGHIKFILSVFTSKRIPVISQHFVSGFVSNFKSTSPERRLRAKFSSVLFLNGSAISWA